MPIFYNTKQFNGWIIGDFWPTLIETKNFEVGIHNYPKGHKSDGHYHKRAIEINVILSGQVRINDEEGHEILNADDIFIYGKNERSDIEILEDTKLLVIKVPSIPGDKHYD